MRTLVLIGALVISGAAAATDVEHSFQSVVPGAGIKRVVIDVPAGAFTVRTGSPGRLSVAGVASRDFDSAKEKIWAQKVVNDTSVEYYVNGAEAVLRPKFGPNARSWRARKFSGMELRIDIPAGIDVVFETTAGEIDLAGDFGNIRVDMRAGEIDLKMPKARVRELHASARVGEVRAHLGNEVVTREGVLPGRTNFYNPSGTSIVNLHVTAGEVRVTLTQ